MGDPVTGKIRFSSYCKPPLEPGKYKVGARQTVTELHGKANQGAPEWADPFTVSFEFVVGGPRFALNLADIYSVYPPESSTGNFAACLPHIVFTRRTIPWERKIFSASPARQPWMALLLFSAEEGNQGTGIPKIQPRKVNELFDKAELPPDYLARVQRDGCAAGLPSDVAGPRGLKFEKYELDDPCNTVDLDAELFRRVAPSVTDLDFLAHVREVDTDHKETASFLTDGSFSVVIGNRFPSAKSTEGGDPVENRAILVSLEGMQNFLPVPGGQPQDTAKTLRLAVLASWAFRCEKSRDFKRSMEKLGETLLPLRLQFAKDLSPDASSEAAQYVHAAFSRGYVALNHNTRRGEKTVSWYRGPLAPQNKDMDVPARYDFKAVPDALVRYDQTKGLMDLTYAGASQLGRLLGLQDRSFAQALSAWRTEVQNQIKARLEKEELRRNLRSRPADESLLRSPDSEFLESALTDAMTRKKAAAERPGDSFRSTLEAKAKAGDAPAKQWRAAHELPETVSDWLARRVLLYGVPFLYLVPDERMLPMPSMRFFRIDPLWIKRLLEGACSVGRNSTEAEVVDELLGDEFFKIAVTGAAKVRRRPPSDDIGGRKNAGPPPNPTFPFDGFLLRSPIVRGWQGLEMEAWYWKKEKGEYKEAPAPPLRIDRLAPDIMLCIFNGPLARIEIRQPPEGMHFGAEGFRKASLRYVTAKNPGEQFNLKSAVEIPFRGDKAFKVVDVQKLKELLHIALTNAPGMDKGAPLTSFTSAEFAVQMTESPGRVEIKVGDKP